MRTVVPEILDTLDPGHADAIRSRRDLKRLDWFLGGSRWIVRKAGEHRDVALSGVVELGAGEGGLCNALALHLEGCTVTGLDLIPPKVPLRDGVEWKKGDVFQTLPGMSAGIGVGNLVLHHFGDCALRSLGGILGQFRLLLFSEPLRHPWSLMLSFLGFPFVGTVTRHDMPASIRAGFRRGELGRLLGLDRNLWKISESSRIGGVIRFQAWRV